MDIHAIPIKDINTFLIENKKNININPYDTAFELMQQSSTSYRNVPKSIIEWMKAYNVIKNKTSILRYSINEIKQLSDQELRELADKLTMKSTNIENMINIFILFK